MCSWALYNRSIDAGSPDWLQQARASEGIDHHIEKPTG